MINTYFLKKEGKPLPVSTSAGAGSPLVPRPEPTVVAHSGAHAAAGRRRMKDSGLRTRAVASTALASAAPGRATSGQPPGGSERCLTNVGCIHHIDWLLLGAVLCLTMVGLAMIYSTTVNPITRPRRAAVLTQGYAIGLGLVRHGRLRC